MSGVPKALRSAPAQKVPLSPHSTATDAESSRVEFVERREQLGCSRAVDRVARLRPVHDDRRHRAVALAPRTPGHIAPRRTVHLASINSDRRAAPPVRRRSRCRPCAARAPGHARQQLVGQHRIGEQVTHHCRGRDESAGNVGWPRPSRQEWWPVRSPAGRSHSLRGELGRVVVAGTAAPALGRAPPPSSSSVEVVRPHPHALA